MTWRSIKDDPPPRDGNPFRVGRYKSSIVSETVFWHTDIAMWKRGWFRSYMEFDNHNKSWMPTYWQPLPPPPKDADT